MNRKEMLCYYSDASGLSGVALNVLFPKTSEEIKKIVNTARTDIVPRGGGTGLSGGSVPNNSLVVDVSKMNKVTNFDPKRRVIEVEAGMTLKELNEKLSRINFEFPILPFNRETTSLGGMVARNAYGNRSLRYGRVREWLENVEFVNGKGEVVRVGKNDLGEVCGMEGTTGIITKITLKILPKIKRSIGIFQSDSLEETLRIARKIKMDKDATMLLFLSKKVSELLDFPEKYHLIIEFDSERGKIKNKEYKEMLEIESKIYDSLYANGYLSSEDFRFFTDKIPEFLILLEKSNIPYFSYVGIGSVTSFFKGVEVEKKEKLREIALKIGGKKGRYEIGLLRKYLVDDYEKKILKRIKLRQDPSIKINKNKLLDLEAEKSLEKLKKIEERDQSKVNVFSKPLPKDSLYKPASQKRIEEQKKEESKKEKFEVNEIQKENEEKKSEMRDEKGKDEDFIRRIMTNRYSPEKNEECKD